MVTEKMKTYDEALAFSLKSFSISELEKDHTLILDALIDPKIFWHNFRDKYLRNGTDNLIGQKQSSPGVNLNRSFVSSSCGDNIKGTDQ